MMLEKNKKYTTEDFLNNPPKKEHLTYRNSMEVACLEEWQGYQQILEDAMNFIEVKTNELRDMISHGTTWQDIAQFGEQVGKEFESFQDEIKWNMF